MGQICTKMNVTTEVEYTDFTASCCMCMNTIVAIHNNSARHKSVNWNYVMPVMKYRTTTCARCLVKIKGESPYKAPVDVVVGYAMICATPSFRNVKNWMKVVPRTNGELGHVIEALPKIKKGITTEHEVSILVVNGDCTVSNVEGTDEFLDLH